MSGIRSAAGLLVAACLIAGCSSSQVTPAFTPEEQREVFKKEVSGEFKLLIDMEQKLGSDHSQVRQMKMEMGLDVDRPASEQSL